jgi:purine-binding chemotaxis protein CheW
MDDSDTQALHTLSERARLLALAATDNDQSRRESIVEFSLSEARYTLPARVVREVVPLLSLTPLPGVPAWIAGLINVRGQILTAIDIRPLLDLPLGRAPAQMLIIVAPDRGAEVALVADLVTVVEREMSMVMPSLMVERSVVWARGLDATMSMLLDATRLLADPRLVIDDMDPC